jgi:undecaprenyl-phosphate 4-deoxy-4-formamido-L-arabinose transferase
MPLMGGPSISVVVPVFNGAATVEALVTRCTATLESLASAYEIVLVDDGSHDESWETLVRLAAHHPQVTALRLTRNYGQHNALLAGVRAARHEIVVTLDDDLQNPPEEMPKLLAELERGHDVVYGTPEDEHHDMWRTLASRITKLALQSAMGADTARQVSPFRAFRTQTRTAFADYSGPFVSIDVLLTWGTTRFSAVKVRHDARSAGTSNYTFRKLVTHAVNMMTGFSIRPLQLASLIGFGFAVFGALVLAYVLVRVALAGGSVPGFPFLASIIAIFSGAQLFALGIIGEYLARMHFRTMQKPSYTVGERIGAGA